MTRIEEAIEVNVPPHAAYGQWMRFEQFPRFMEGVQEVRRTDESHLHWIADCDGKRMEWDTELTAQTPDQMVAWRSTSGAANNGMVRFTPLDAGRTRIELEMNSESERDGHGTPEDLEMLSGRVRRDLQRFRSMLETQDARQQAQQPQQQLQQDVQDHGQQQGRQEGWQRTQQTAPSGAGPETYPDTMRMDTGTVPNPENRPDRGLSAHSGAAWLPHLRSMWEEPFAMMRRMSEEMDRMVERFIGRAPPLQGMSNVPQWTPAIEITQQGDQLLVSADLPGMSRDDVRVEVRGDKLVIEGQRQETVPEGDPGARRSERRFGRFYRMIALPSGTSPDGALATMQDGVLRIRIPVADIQTRARTIEVQQGRMSGIPQPPSAADGRGDGLFS